MIHAAKIKLAESSFGRVLLHLACLARDGKLRWHQWETPEGDKRSKVEIVADDIELLGSRGEGGGGNYSAPSAPAAPADPVIDDDIPF